MSARWLLIGLVSALLGGCSIVGSDEPLFTAADSVGAPVLRPGLWAMPNENCDYKEASPADGWPRCANATVVTADRIAGGERGPSGETKGSLAYRIAAGDPPILQVAAPEDEKDGPRFIYAGMRSTKTDKKGRTTEARIWLGLCNKPPKLEDGKMPEAPSANDPLPEGLEARPGGACIAKSAEAARTAVTRSEAWLTSGGESDAFLIARWVREGER
jgi:hypothetical protein